MTERTRLIIVIRADVAANANLASKLVDLVGGEFTWNVALAKPGHPTVVVAYWCNWAMKPSEVTSLKTEMQERGFTEANVANVNPGDTPHANAKAVVFSAANWTPAEVLAALGLQRIEVFTL
jgi:hypothetical protein